MKSLTKVQFWSWPISIIHCVTTCHELTNSQLYCDQTGLLWQEAEELLRPADQCLYDSEQAHPCLHPSGAEESAPWSKRQVSGLLHSRLLLQMYSHRPLTVCRTQILTLSVLILRYYGCGLVVPESLEGCRILDLGSGSGRDCYMLSQLVGEKGHVTGIDMTEDQVLYILHRVQRNEAAILSVHSHRKDSNKNRK